MKLQEMSEETGIPIAELHLSRDNLERALMARLMDEISSEWPLHYLMASYNRLSDELRSLTSIGDQAVLERVTDTLVYSKQLTVSYSGLLLSMDMFPQVSQPKGSALAPAKGKIESDPAKWGTCTIAGQLFAQSTPYKGSGRLLANDPTLQSMVTSASMYQHWQAGRLYMSILCVLQPDSASQRGALQLLDALDKKGGKAVAHPAYPMPTGFLEDLAARFEQEGLDSMLGPTGARCSATRNTSAVPAMCTRLSTVVRLR